MEMTRLNAATMIPNPSVFRNAKVSCQNRSWPRELVPNQYSPEGGRSGNSTNCNSGTTGETNDNRE